MKLSESGVIKMNQSGRATGTFPILVPAEPDGVQPRVQRMLCEAEDRAYQLLKDNRAQLDKLADALLEREELDRDDVAKLLGPRPGKADGVTAG